METIGRIRRERLVKGKPIKEIARDLKISRNTVRKVLRSEKTSFSYQRVTQPRLRLGRWKADLERMLTENVEKAARERLTLIRLFEELRALGYEGGYDAVRRYARSWSRDHAAQTAAVFVPLSFAPGEAYQFDWSHECHAAVIDETAQPEKTIASDCRMRREIAVILRICPSIDAVNTRNSGLNMSARSKGPPPTSPKG